MTRGTSVTILQWLQKKGPHHPPCVSVTNIMGVYGNNYMFLKKDFSQSCPNLIRIFPSSNNNNNIINHSSKQQTRYVFHLSGNDFAKKFQLTKIYKTALMNDLPILVHKNFMYRIYVLFLSLAAKFEILQFSFLLSWKKEKIDEVVNLVKYLFTNLLAHLLPFT